MNKIDKLKTFYAKITKLVCPKGDTLIMTVLYSFKKFQKIHKIIAFTAAYPKTQRAILALLVLWGLKLKASPMQEFWVL
jgi:hypothetical protein